MISCVRPSGIAIRGLGDASSFSVSLSLLGIAIWSQQSSYRMDLVLPSQLLNVGQWIESAILVDQQKEKLHINFWQMCDVNKAC